MKNRAPSSPLPSVLPQVSALQGGVPAALFDSRLKGVIAGRAILRGDEERPESGVLASRGAIRLRYERVEVAPGHEVGPLCADVSRFDQDIAAELLLNAEVVLPGVIHLGLALRTPDLKLVGGTGRKRDPARIVPGIEISPVVGGIKAARGVGSGAIGFDAGRGGWIVESLLRNLTRTGIVIEAGTGADHPGVADAVSDAETRSEVVRIVGNGGLGDSVDAALNDSRAFQRADTLVVFRPPIQHSEVVSVGLEVILVANAPVDRELLVDFPIVVDEEGHQVVAHLQLAALAGGAELFETGIAQQEVGVLVASGLAVILPESAANLSVLGVVVGDLALKAVSDVVLAADPGHGRAAGVALDEVGPVGLVAEGHVVGDVDARHSIQVGDSKRPQADGGGIVRILHLQKLGRVIETEAGFQDLSAAEEMREGGVAGILLPVCDVTEPGKALPKRSEVALLAFEPATGDGCLFREAMIGFDGPHVDVGSDGAGGEKVIGTGGEIGGRDEFILNLPGDWVDAVCGDHVAGERQICERIVDDAASTEIAVTLGKCGDNALDGGVGRVGIALAGAFPSDEEECLVLAVV